MDSVRRQFETNVFGLLRLTQLVLPGMRAAGDGRIVNMSSMGGRLPFPGGAPTTPPSTRWRRSATRCASRSRRFGIEVIIVEPGLIRTEFDAIAASGVDSAPTGRTPSSTGRSRATRDVYEGPM